MTLLSKSLPPAVLLGVGGLVFFVAGLGQGELYRNETLRAQLAAEMLRTGQWIVPTLYGEPLLTKPPLQYWLVALLSLPFGQVTETTARLPSVLGALALLAACYAHFRSVVGPHGALAAALAMPVGWLWLEKVPSAELDMLLTAGVGLALLAAWRALDAVAERRRSAEWAWWTVALLCIALGVLTKWTAWLYFYAALVPLCLWQRRLGQLFRPAHLLAVLAGVAVVLVWAGLLVGQIGWENAVAQIGTEARAKFVPSHHGSGARWGETLLHPLKILAVTLPWSLWALLTCLPSWWRTLDQPTRQLAQGLTCWFWPNLLLFTLLPEHGTRHSFPFMPAAALLGGLVWWQAWRGQLDPKLAAGHRRLAFGVGRAVSLRAVPRLVVGGGRAPRRGAGGVREGWQGSKVGAWARVFGCLIIAWMVVKLAWITVVLPYRDEARSPRAKGAQVAALVPRDAPLYLGQFKDEGVMFYSGRAARRVRDWEQLTLSTRPVYLLVTPGEWEQLGPRDDWRVLAEHRLRDSQGDPVILAVVVRGTPSIRIARQN
ncbi:MAG TPA: glycosyltransferase family 39 protein [Gemmatales bacterium]|nr:glycosyltransferase family 39 protein [Gemmatales bacterium]